MNVTPARSLQEEAASPAVFSQGGNGAQISLINPVIPNPWPKSYLKHNPIGGFFIHTDSAGKTGIYIIGHCGVQDHKANADSVSRIGMPDSTGLEVPRLLHPEQQTRLTGAKYDAGNTCRLRLDLPADLGELKEGLQSLVDGKYIGQPFMDATLAALELSRDTQIGDSARQVQMERIADMVRKSAVGAALG